MSDNIYSQVVNAYVAHQPWFVRRKDTIVVVAGLVLQVLQVLAVHAAQAPAWVSLVVAVAIGLAQAIITSGTKGAITPSMGERLARAAETLHHVEGRHRATGDVVAEARSRVEG